MTRRHLAAAVSMLALAGVAAGCEEAVEKIEKAELEKEVKKSLTGQVSEAPKAIRCPGGIEAKAGARTRCTFVASDDSKIGVRIRITDVEGGTTKFAIRVGNKVRPQLQKAELEQKVKKAITARVAQAPKAIRCPGGVEAKVGAKTRCTLVATDDTKVDVDVRVSNVQGTTTELAIKVANEARR